MCAAGDGCVISKNSPGKVDVIRGFMAECHVYIYSSLLHISLGVVRVLLPPELIFHSRIIGACPVTTDCTVAMS